MLDENHYTKLVDTHQNKLRIDRYLTSVKVPTSRSRLQKLIKKGKVKVNNEVITSPHYYVKYHDLIEIEFPKPPRFPLEPEQIPLKIIYEDQYLVVIDKPAGLVVHPAKGNRTGTLVNALLYHTSLSSQGEDQFRPGIVHRLDKNTSGVMVVAKTEKSYRILAEMVGNREITRIYLCLVWGQPEKEGGVVEAPIGRSRIDRKKMAVTSFNSKTAKTHYQVLVKYGAASLVKCQLQTGRTHQIRVHMNYLGHPILGDETYGGTAKFPPGVKRKWSHQIPQLSQLVNRQALHATYLNFQHPITKKFMKFKSPLPGDIKKACLYLNQQRKTILDLQNN